MNTKVNTKSNTKFKTKIIAIINPNGGVAKSNTARTIARGLQLSGKPCALVETDPQGSLQAWRDMGYNEKFTMPVVWPYANLNDALKAKVNSKHHQALVIDGAAANVAVTAELAELADMVIIPVQPSPDDFIQLGELLTLVKSCNTDAYMLLTRVRKNSKWLALAQDFFVKNNLKNFGYVRETEEIKHAAFKGLTAHECRNNGVAKTDAQSLNTNVLKALF